MFLHKVTELPEQVREMALTSSRHVVPNDPTVAQPVVAALVGLFKECHHLLAHEGVQEAMVVHGEETQPVCARIGVRREPVRTVFASFPAMVLHVAKVARPMGR